MAIYICVSQNIVGESDFTSDSGYNSRYGTISDESQCIILKSQYNKYFNIGAGFKKETGKGSISNTYTSWEVKIIAKTYPERDGTTSTAIPVYSCESSTPGQPISVQIDSIQYETENEKGTTVWENFSCMKDSALQNILGKKYFDTFSLSEIVTDNSLMREFETHNNQNQNIKINITVSITESLFLYVSPTTVTVKKNNTEVTTTSGSSKFTQCKLNDSIKVVAPATGDNLQVFKYWADAWNGDSEINMSVLKPIVSEGGRGLDFSIKESISLKAIYGAQTLEIGTSVSPAGSGTVSGADTYVNGNTATLTATPNTGYEFVYWSKDGAEVSRSNPYTFTVSVTTDGVYTAHFSRKTYQITLTIGPTGAGTVSGGGTYSHGNTATLRATPNTGYEFVYWSKGGTEVSRNNPYEFDVTANGTYAANFRKIESGEEEGDVVGDGKIATNKDIAAKSNYVFEFTGNENKCPTKSEINSGSDNIANISNVYTSNQCVKYTDVVFNKININCKIETSITAFVKAPYVEIFRGNDKFATLYDASDSTTMNVDNDKNSTTQIDCTHLNDSSSKNANLKIRVYRDWGGNRIIKVTCNGETIESGQTKDFTANFNIYFKDFLKNKYDVNVFFSE